MEDNRTSPDPQSRDAPWSAGVGNGPTLATYAAQAGLSRGRLISETDSRTRTAFQRDRDRIVHSTAFRRLKDKTQVFVADEGDHFRTRLTHTIEVSQIARAFARALRLDEDLTEAIALVHDFGHTPFGHAGERALSRKMLGAGGFDHNAQALRVVTALEHRYAGFDGLNLTWETLEGLVKHNGPLVGMNADPHKTVPRPVADFDAIFPLDLASFASLEAQAAAISDDIAYNTHDLDDGLRAGLISIDDLRNLDLAGSLLSEVERAYPGLEPTRIGHEILRRHITRMVEDVIETSLERLRELAPMSAQDVRRANRPVIAFSNGMREAVEQTRAFLFQRVYRDQNVMAVMKSAEEVIERLFDAFICDPASMPAGWGARAGQTTPDGLRPRIADYLSGMTDTYALKEFSRVFGDKGVRETLAGGLVKPSGSAMLLARE